MAGSRVEGCRRVKKEKRWYQEPISLILQPLAGSGLVKDVDAFLGVELVSLCIKVRAHCGLAVWIPIPQCLSHCVVVPRYRAL